MTLPTGGAITYGYNGMNSMMADGSPAIMSRTLGGGTWNYTRGYQTDSSHPRQTTTTVLDPSSPHNETDLRFSGIYLTDKAVYQGAKSSLLDYSYICYDPNAHNNAGCPTATVTAPITWMATADALNNMTYGSTLYSGVWNYYDTYGNLTQELDYDYGISTHALLRNKIISYSTALCSNHNICDHPSSMQVYDGTGTSKSYTTYTYDEDVHTHGSVTTISRSSTGLTGGPFLAQHYSYDPNGTGTLASATDPKGTITTYNYTSASCNYAFPTSVTVQNLTTSYAYDCRGGVVTSATDPNHAGVSTSYNDPYYWRPASVTDQAGKITSISYPAVGQVESIMLFNGNLSTYDFVTISDSYGRPWLEQKREGPSPAWTTFDTVATDYDVAGRVLSTTSQPASCTLGNDCTTAKATTTYDGAGRPILVTAADGGSMGSTYTQNDVLYTVGPAHDGEITKSRNFEYDVLGRLTSVCEVTGSGTSGCGSQTSPPAHGSMTTYGYDPLGDLISVTQGSTQTRTYRYDGIARILQEINAENGTTNYSYDSDSTCSSSAGDMVKRVNAAGTTCFYYDALHRLTDAGNGYEGGSPVCRRYRYDSAIVNGATMSNVAGRLAETKTDNCAGTQLTDEGFSYSPRGEVTDVYQSSSYSGGYYHVSSSYWDNGVLETISGVPGMPTITYGTNQGGAPYTVSASSGQNPITYAAYNAARQLINLTLGSGDTDSFGYDGQTGRFTQYKYNVGATPQTVEGDLTWNQNGTLKTLAITDGTNSANSQTCKYVYDDLVRLSTVNCQNTGLQNVWNQIFGYDVFGNITKTIPSGGTGISFQPTYSSSTNQITSLPGATVTYGPDGNLLQDGAHTYTWDVNWGNISSVDGKSLSFDALGRMVEQASGASYTQILYGPSGGKLALMNGQTLQKARVPLLGGAQAVYNASGLLYYRHSDWLGSSRLAVKPDRTVYFDVAYAPFGEDYNDGGNQDLSFTGQDQDTASGLYDFMFREYSPVQGRWISPDPAGLAAVDITNPQSWNRYAYVLNNPLSNTDPQGLWCYYGTTNDDGLIDTSNPDAGDSSNYDFQSTQPECEGPHGSNGGTWYPDDITIRVTDLLPPMVDTSSIFQLQAANNGRVPNKITCNTVLPNGQTVGDVVQQQRAALSNAVIPGTNVDNLPAISLLITFASIAGPGGPIDFKNNFKGQANPNLLASAGNFAYYAIGSGNVSTFALDAGAGAYGLFTSTFGSRPFSDLTGPMYSDSNAAAVRNSALASNGCHP